MKTTLPGLLLTLVLLSQSGPAGQAKPGSAGERTSVDLTIYNQNLSLIREERSFTLARGFSSVVVPEIGRAHV